MTLYSGDACGTLESRSSSRSAAFLTSSGICGFVDLLAQLVRFGLLRIGLAELFLNRAQLLAQVELALILLHLALDVGLDLVTQLDDFELLGEEHRELAQPLLGVALFEDRLAVGRVEPHRRRDEVRQEIGVGDVVDFHLHLARRLRQIAQQFLEERARDCGASRRALRSRS